MSLGTTQKFGTRFIHFTNINEIKHIVVSIVCGIVGAPEM